MFEEMHENNITPNETTFSILIKHKKGKDTNPIATNWLGPYKTL